MVAKRKMSRLPGIEFGLHSHSGHGGEETFPTPLLINSLIITHAI
jgi:hypothetical protein